MGINGPKIIHLPKIEDVRGNLTFLEENSHIPFQIKRVYWIYDVPGGQVRGGHAFKQQEEFIVALSGSFDIVIDDNLQNQTFSLKSSYYGLFIPKGVWRQMVNFSTNSLAMVISSTFYDADDYLYNYDKYKTWVNK